MLTNQNYSNFAELAICPKSHPFAYSEGKYCCKHGIEKNYAPHGDKCDGGTISIHSTCCKDDEYVDCLSGLCKSFVSWHMPQVWILKRQWCQSKRTTLIKLVDLHTHNIHNPDYFIFFWRNSCLCQLLVFTMLMMHNICNGVHVLLRSLQ